MCTFVTCARARAKGPYQILWRRKQHERRSASAIAAASPVWKPLLVPMNGTSSPMVTRLVRSNFAASALSIMAGIGIKPFQTGTGPAPIAAASAHGAFSFPSRRKVLLRHRPHMRSTPHAIWPTFNLSARRRLRAQQLVKDLPIRSHPCLRQELTARLVQ